MRYARPRAEACFEHGRRIYRVLSLGSPNKERHPWWRFLFGYAMSVELLLRASEASGQRCSITRNRRRCLHRACDDGICAMRRHTLLGVTIRKNISKLSTSTLRFELGCFLCLLISSILFTLLNQLIVQSHLLHASLRTSIGVSLH